MATYDSKDSSYAPHDKDASADEMKQLNSIRAIAAPGFRGIVAAAVVFMGYGFINGGKATTPTAQPTAITGPSSTESPVAGATIAPGTVQNGQVAQVGVTDGTTGQTGGVVGAVEKIGEGFKVQVLQGNDTPKASYESAIAALKAMGFEVKSGGKASKKYDTTTIFQVTGKEQIAQALRDADPRFRELKPKPDTISAKDDVHVVVGTDWVVAAGEGSTTTGTAASDSSTDGATAQPMDGTTQATGQTGTYDPATSTALPAGTQGANTANTLPNFAGAQANTNNPARPAVQQVVPQTGVQQVAPQQGTVQQGTTGTTTGTTQQGTVQQNAQPGVQQVTPQQGTIGTTTGTTQQSSGN